LRSVEEVAEAARRIPRPLVVNVPPDVRWRPEELERAGCRLAIYPAELQRAAIAAMRQAAQQLRERGFVDGIELASGDERDALVDTEAWQSLAGRYEGAG
ncbi:MAG: hypothetical protein RMM30_08065, partial [Armatimonadota bacterium]|nr:hypothetical protein [Armatimonadota bacterium]MDW8156520.1 hypothetical protein [Armatimonadota bacterium]